MTAPSVAHIELVVRPTADRPLCGIIDEKLFSRGINLLQEFQRAFYMQIAKAEKLLKGKRYPKNSTADLYQIMVKELNNDFTSGLTCPPAAEMSFCHFRQQQR
jgi:hypothetical protein